MDDTSAGTELRFSSLLRVALDVLASRSYRWVVTLLTFALFTYTAIRPDPYRLGAAVAFTVLVALPSLWRREAK